MRKLLEGVRVLDTGILLGATTGMHLADLGADVIKIESPFRGDYQRDFLGQITPHHSPVFMECNKNKRSVTLDLRMPKGVEIFFELLKGTDVFIDGRTAGQSDGLGIGYDAQRKVKPDIVYCQFSGFGANGPWASIPTHGMMMSALAAAVPMGLDGEGGVEPIQNTDVYGGTASGGDANASAASYAAMHVLAALVHRDRTGEGSRLDASGADGVIAAGHIGAVSTLNFERIIDREQFEGSRTIDRSLNSKYTYYRTKDDRIVLIAAIEHKFWDNFCRVVGREDLSEHKDESRPTDWGMVAGLREQVQEIFATKTLAEWMDIAAREKLPIGPANRIGDLLDDPQIRAREIIVESEHPSAGPFTYIGSSVMVEGQPYEITRHSPELGEHTAEVLGELGYTEEQVGALHEEGVV